MRRALARRVKLIRTMRPGIIVAGQSYETVQWACLLRAVRAWSHGSTKKEAPMKAGARKNCDRGMLSEGRLKLVLVMFMLMQGCSNVAVPFTPHR